MARTQKELVESQTRYLTQPLISTQNPRIINCDTGNNKEMDPTKCIGLFSFIPSNTGLAYVFNGPGLSEIFRDTNSTYQFIAAVNQSDRAR